MFVMGIFVGPSRGGFGRGPPTFAKSFLPAIFANSGHFGPCVNRRPVVLSGFIDRLGSMEEEALA
jgi:hypothetical protein